MTSSPSMGPMSALLDHAGNRLRAITERTENASRPTLHLITQHSDALRWSAHIEHARAATETCTLPPPGRRAGDLIAFFEGCGHARMTSAPAGPRSTSLYFPNTTRLGKALSYSSGTGFGYSTAGYTSRPSLPSLLRRPFSVSSPSRGPFSMSSLLSPPPMSLSSDSRVLPPSSDSRTAGCTNSNMCTLTPTTPTNTFTGTNTCMNTLTSTNTNTGTYTTTTPPPTSSLRHPQTSPCSLLTSVRNLVAAWKERTPREGLFSVRRRAERGQAQLREWAYKSVRGEGERETICTGRGEQSESALLPPPCDIAELCIHARGSQEVSASFSRWFG
ncbi:hypothetical protein NEOLEDRAFT_1177827 [Neolentinus lepideus HHB14362 ss-1]|uniref:Uncharacterized protein n=1 Tax=Neolentinus lepideus HHB14362 ss-1 TaxID=1314782 RepID=A0A165T1N9_9AGAM|nr:hypothetical protein NEOLEDRAFT_1177827 [Neolentinus lepideus HHB14362 ss-1]